MTFLQKLSHIIDKNNSLICVGLDCDFDKLPEMVKSSKYPQFAFNKAIIDATHDLVCAYKPNMAFYESRGERGLKELQLTMDYLRSTCPEVCTICDGKRADIGSTNSGYVTSIFDYYGFDSVTLHPYLGKEALEPFLLREEKGCFILCRTSNPGAGEFQDMLIDNEPLYLKIAQHVINNWNVNQNCLLVVGATYPQELAKVRKLSEQVTFLVPGIGTQGGDIEATLKAGLNSEKQGLIINSSRSVIFASSGTEFSSKAREAAESLQKAINHYRNIL